MKRIVVNSLPLRDVISDIAAALDTGIEKKCDQYILKIPSNFGSGQITGVNFANDMGFLLYNCEFKEDFEIQFVINEIHPLKFIFCLKGTLEHRFANENIKHELIKYQNAIVSSSKVNGHILCFKKNEQTAFNSLEISRENFYEKYICEIESLSKPLQNLFCDVKALNQFYYDGFYSLELSDLFDEINNFEHGSFLMKTFLEGKSYEILTKQLLQYEDDLKNEGHRVLLRISEVKKVKEAIGLIDANIAKYKNLKIISKTVGLNQSKLQYGFQYFFNQTIHQYLQEKRLEQSKILLLQSDNSISDVIHLLGITSRSYFSKLFKNKYGLTPSSYKAQFNKVKSELNK